MANSGPNGEWLATTPEFWAQFDEPIIGFQLWYADGTVVHGGPGELVAAWDSAPCSGVVVMMIHHAAHDRRTIVAGKDAYTYPNLDGEKLGQEIGADAYRAMKRAAINDTWRAFRGDRWAFTT